MSANNSLPTLTIAIPTYNRGEILQHVCESLLCQTISADRFCILIVDNNSTDDTRQRIGEVQKHFPHFSYIIERNTGSSHARNAAWKHCTTPWIAYLDDDAKPTPHYVEAILRAMRQDCDVIAGKVIPWRHQPLPSWFIDEYETYSPNPAADGYLSSKDFAIGGNMVFKLASIQAAGGFNTCLGVNGTVVPYGEETELQIRIRARGGRIWYAPDVLVAHLAKTSRYTVSNLLHIAYLSGKSTPIIYGWKGKRHFFRLVLKVPYRLATSLGKSVYRLCHRTYSWQNAVISVVGECLFLAGMFKGFFWLRKQGSSPFLQRSSG